MNKVDQYFQQHISHFEENQLVQFREDVLHGLLSIPKRLSSKYFYDKRGDELFQKIMRCSEYYLFRCELEIFQEQASVIVNVITKQSKEPFDLIELGVGDGTKSRFLLHELLERKLEFTYLPIDISGNILSHLESSLAQLHGLHFRCLEGEYFDTLVEATKILHNRKVVLFLGSNIGNMSVEKAQEFCKTLRGKLQPGDIVLIGFDLKKNPQIILDAYNDKGGLTRDFNLNLLERINRELEGNFDVNQFSHFPTYDPATGTCKSYLVSRIKQTVAVADVPISFGEGEWIFMEISQKFSCKEIDKLGTVSGFKTIHSFTDSRQWFVDAVWVAV